VAVAPPSLVPSVRAAPLFALAEPANTLCVPVVAVVVVAAVVAEDALCVNLGSASSVVDVPSPANAPSGPNPTSSSASTAFKNGLNCLKNQTRVRVVSRRRIWTLFQRGTTQSFTHQEFFAPRVSLPPSPSSLMVAIQCVRARTHLVVARHGARKRMCMCKKMCRCGNV